MREVNELDIKQELPDLNTKGNSTLSYPLAELKSEIKNEDDVFIKIEPLITEETHIKEEYVDVELQLLEIYTISPDEIYMHINPGLSNDRPEEPSLATLTITATDPHTRETKINRFNCEYDGCTRTYSTVGNLRTHMKTHKGMYTMRMLDSNNALNNLSMSSAGTAAISRADVERMDTSSDSAVSSMGSERVPSLSDGEWCDAGSDSGHTVGDHYVVDYHTTSKYLPYDHSYSSRQHSSTLGSSDAVRMPPVAEKKHQMFGKRYFQEQGATNTVTQPTPVPIKYEYPDPSTSSFSSPSQAEGAVGPKPQEIKYSCSMEFGRHSQMGRSPITHVQHNHTCHLPDENTGAMQRPVSRDKGKVRKSEDEHLTRDEKRARALSVPIAVDDIINLSMDEFNERLSKYDLSETQLSLIRDIRRRGKNKVAAQNCRKRKLDQILSLADKVKKIRDRKIRMLSEQDFVLTERQRIKDKYQQLYRHVFQNLRDPDGNPYSSYQYSLQTSADGSILIVPYANNSLPNQE